MIKPEKEERTSFKHPCDVTLSAYDTLTVADTQQPTVTLGQHKHTNTIMNSKSSFYNR